MNTPIFSVCKASQAVIDVLGGPLPRLYPFGEAPAGVEKPYAVYQMVSGAPLNTLTVPESDQIGIQIDVFGRTQAEATKAFIALRNAVQTKGYVTGYNANEREDETNLWRLSFDVDWIVDR